MEIRRTANAGVLLKTDGISVLLDGVCKRIAPYEETPESIKKELMENFPDVVAFTHRHDDHYDDYYARTYKEMTLRPVYGSEVFFYESFSNVRIQSVPTRHIGKVNISHSSFIIEGSKCVWFMGDASPLDWRNKENLPFPDVIIAPFAYANSPSAWRITKELGAEKVVIVHMPERENDPYGIWSGVEKTVGSDESVLIPQMGETVIL